MKHRGHYTTSLLFIFLLVTIGISGKWIPYLWDKTVREDQFERRFCGSQTVRSWPPAKRQLCNRGVYINSDNETAIEYLPNIGPKRARAIVEYRNVHGPFDTLKEIENVKGIGPNTLSKIKPWIEDVPIDLMEKKREMK